MDNMKLLSVKMPQVGSSVLRASPRSVSTLGRFKLGPKSEIQFQHISEHHQILKGFDLAMSKAAFLMPVDFIDGRQNKKQSILTETMTQRWH